MLPISNACASLTAAMPPCATSAMPGPFAEAGGARRYTRVDSVSPLPRNTCDFHSFTFMLQVQGTDRKRGDSVSPVPRKTRSANFRWIGMTRAT